jgi:hypothetical protein
MNDDPTPEEIALGRWIVGIAVAIAIAVPVSVMIWMG